MSDFGGQLKEARERKGISLREIAAATKISVVALESLERNDFSRLPGGIFSRAFVRAYALEVGLDPDLTVQNFLEEFARADVKRDRGPRPEVTADDRAFLARQQRAARILRFVLIGLVLLVLGAVLMWRYGPKLRSTLEREQPASTAAAPAAQTEGPVGPPAAAPVLPPLSTPAVDLTPAAAPPAIPPASTHRLAIHLSLNDDCWVSARTDGAVAFRQILHAGDQRELEADEEISMEVGNSGALTWTINGRPAKPLGKAGQRGTAVVTPASVATFVK
jgi:cytoskeleton protein RodZ